MSENKEIRQVMEQEKRRGTRRKPLDMVTLAQNARIRAKLLRAMSDYNEAGFIDTIAELGHVPGSPEYERLMKIWRETVGSYRP